MTGVVSFLKDGDAGAAACGADGYRDLLALVTISLTFATVAVHSWQTYGNGKTGDRNNKRSKMQLTMWLFCMVGALLLLHRLLGTLRYPVPYAAGIFPLWMLVTAMLVPTKRNVTPAGKGVKWRNAVKRVSQVKRDSLAESTRRSKGFEVPERLSKSTALSPSELMRPSAQCASSPRSIKPSQSCTPSVTRSLPGCCLLFDVPEPFRDDPGLRAALIVPCTLVMLAILAAQGRRRRRHREAFGGGRRALCREAFSTVRRGGVEFAHPRRRFRRPRAGRPFSSSASRRRR